MIIGASTIHLYLPGTSSLKEKRSIIKSILARLQSTFKVSAAEVDFNDMHQSALIGVAVVSNSSRHAYEIIDKLPDWIEANYPDVTITEHHTEIR